jgi:acid phosphatase
MIRISRRCKGTLAALILACAGVSAVLLTAAPAGAGVTTYNAVADAFTASDLPGTVENGTYVSQDGSPSRYGYYKFTVAVPAGEFITSAVFQCWAGSSNTAGMGLWSAASTWSEATLTWNNAPPANFALPASGATGAVTSGRYNPADVTSAITGSGTFTLVGKTTSSTQWSCVSKANTGNHPPGLVVATAPAPPPTSSTPPPSTTAPPPGHTNTVLPARGAFYYPWYPETWGSPPQTRYNPTLGFYDSTAVAASHVASLNYGGFGFAVSSWWGQGSATDGRTQNLLNAAHGTPLKIAAYYEAEGNAVAGVAGSPNPTSAQITADLNYVAAHYINDPNWMWVNDRPVVFAFGDGGDGCGMNDRWAAANAAATQPFYVVLKVFGGYAACAAQPANWHQYGPATRVDQQGTHSYSLSPGYNKWSDPAPMLARDPAGWPAAVQAMNCAAVDLRLITTFNEWGEGTAVESAAEWSSASGQGTYLDALHADQSCGGPTTTPPPSTTPPPPPTGVPVYDHVFYVMFENHNYSDIIGNANAPYLNSLTVSGGLATNYHAVTHPSVNNYLAAVSGQTYSGITDNCTVGSGTCHTGAANLADGVEAGGRTWKGYMETMPSPCYGPHDTGLYTERHNPFPYFDQIRTNPARCARIVPYTQLATDLGSAATTPSFAWVTPNLCDDMHNACPPSNAVTNGDNWAKAEFPKIFASPAWKTQHCLLVINEDENGGAAGNQVPAIFVSSDGTVVAGKRSATNYTHYSLLRTIEASWSIPPVGPGDAAASPMVDMFGP